jgi:glucose-6-phosphate isomerase
MLYRQLTQHCPNPSTETLKKLAPAFDMLRHAHAGDKTLPAEPILHAWHTTKYIPELQVIAGEICSKYADVVVVGAGGSGLSGRVLSSLKPCLKPRLHFLENIDPDAIDDLLIRLDLKQSFFIFISKSGGTVETLAHFHAIVSILEQKSGKAAAQQVLVNTTQTDNPLRRAANARGIRCLTHVSDIGGRFSLFTNVGLLPAAIAGLDIGALLSGAASVAEDLQQAKTADSFAPAIGAALQYDAMRAGRNMSVILPYAQRLEGFSSWYRQSWAESLGKAGKGTTPIRAVGSTDQHSQLQLYLDGPKDKFFTMILMNRRGTGQAIGKLDDRELSYISDKTTGDVLAAEQQATLATIAATGAPVRVMELDKLDEAALGSLLAHFTLEIICMAALLEVNPFDQPAVEEGKRLARNYLLGKTA